MPTIQSEIQQKVIPNIVQKPTDLEASAPETPSPEPASPPRIPLFREIQYKKLTDVHRVQNLDLPERFKCVYGELVIPECLRQKDVHYIVNSQGQVIKAAWIHRCVGLFLNSIGLIPINRQAAYEQLEESLEMVEDEISTLVKNRVLTKRSGPGFMAFCQAHEAVPKNCVLVSARTYAALCSQNRGWKSTSQVSCTRYPNLGPNTTIRLNLLVNDERTSAPQALAPTSLGARFPQLADMLRDMEQEEQEVQLEGDGLLDAVYLHPEVLKQNLQGDGDGDLVFFKRLVKGRARFKRLNLERSAGTINPQHVEQLFKKGSRINRGSLEEYLPPYFDDTPIGKATYLVRWYHYVQAAEEVGSPHPMHEAWKKTGQEAIELIEFIMDMRKGDSSEQEILGKLAYIDQAMEEIQASQEAGDWFARTVTSGRVLFVDEFTEMFKTLQEYLDHITYQSEGLEEENVPNE